MRQVLILGGSSDIGIAVCEEYLNRGATVIAFYHKGQPRFLELLKRYPSKIEPHVLDLLDSAQLEREIKCDGSFLSKSDVLIMAQGLLEPAPFSEVSAEAIIRAMRVNVIPGILLMRTIVPEMVRRKWGRIVQLGSIGVKFGGGSNSFCYALSKHAMEFMPQDHKKWAAHNVLVNTIRVGVTDTRIHLVDPTKDMSARVKLIPMGRMATPEEMAKAIYWFGSEENTFTTGQVITVAGGE